MDLAYLNEQMERRSVRDDDHGSTREEILDSATVLIEVVEGVSLVFAHPSEPGLGVQTIVESEHALELVAGARAQ